MTFGKQISDNHTHKKDKEGQVTTISIRKKILFSLNTPPAHSPQDRHLPHQGHHMLYM